MEWDNGYILFVDTFTERPIGSAFLVTKHVIRLGVKEEVNFNGDRMTREDDTHFLVI